MIAVPAFAKRIVLVGALLALPLTGYAWAEPYAALDDVQTAAFEEETDLDDVQDEDVDDDALYYTADEYLGFWEEYIEGDVRLTVTRGEKGWYGVEISWPRNSHQVDMFTMTAKPTDGNALQYEDGNHHLVTYGQKYIDKEELIYKNGTGRIYMVGDKRIVWEDDQDHKADDIVFVPLRSPLGGGL